MRLGVSLLVSTLGLAAVGGAAAGLRQGASLQAAPHPSRFPAGHVRLDAAPSVWVFVRAGCPHCEAHLRALERCTRDLESGRRELALSRLRVVGDRTGPAGARALPDTLRTALHVRLTPTTWLVRSDGTLLDVWRGARNERAWRRALDFVTGGGAPR